MNNSPNWLIPKYSTIMCHPMESITKGRKKIQKHGEPNQTHATLPQSIQLSKTKI